MTLNGTPRHFVDESRYAYVQQEHIVTLCDSKHELDHKTLMYTRNTREEREKGGTVLELGVT